MLWGGDRAVKLKDQKSGETFTWRLGAGEGLEFQYGGFRIEMSKESELADQELEGKIQTAYSRIRHLLALPRAERYTHLTMVIENGVAVPVPELTERFREFRALINKKVETSGQGDFAKAFKVVFDSQEAEELAEIELQERIDSGERLNLENARSFADYINADRIPREMAPLIAELDLVSNEINRLNQALADPNLSPGRAFALEGKIVDFESQAAVLSQKIEPLENQRQFLLGLVGGQDLAQFRQDFERDQLPYYLNEAKNQGDPPYIDEKKVKEAFTDLLVALRVGDPSRIQQAQIAFQALSQGAQQVDENLHRMETEGLEIGKLQGVVGHYYGKAQEQFNSLLASGGRLEDLPAALEGEFDPRDLKLSFFLEGKRDMEGTNMGTNFTENPQGYYFRVFANTPGELKVAADSFIRAVRRGTYGRGVGPVFEKFRLFKEAIGTRISELNQGYEEGSPEQTAFNEAAEVVRLQLEAHTYIYADNYAINYYDAGGTAQAKEAMFGDNEAKRRLASLAEDELLMATLRKFDFDPNMAATLTPFGPHGEFMGAHNAQFALQLYAEDDFVKRLMRIQLKDYLPGRDPANPSKAARRVNQQQLGNHQSEQDFWDHYEGSDAFWDDANYESVVQAARVKRDLIEKIDFADLLRKSDMITRRNNGQSLTPDEQQFLKEKGKNLTKTEKKLITRRNELVAKRNNGQPLTPEEVQFLRRDEPLTAQEQSLIDRRKLLTDKANLIRKRDLIEKRDKIAGIVTRKNNGQALTPDEQQYLRINGESLSKVDQHLLQSLGSALTPQDQTFLLMMGDRLTDAEQSFLNNEGSTRLSSYEDRVLKLAEDSEFYDTEHAKAKATYDFAMEVYGSTGELATRAAPNFLVKRTENGVDITEVIPIPEAQKFVQFIVTYTKMKYAKHPAAIRDSKVGEAINFATHELFTKGYSAVPLDPDANAQGVHERIQIADENGAWKDPTFEDVLAHPFSMWLSITYANTQEELRHEMLNEVEERDQNGVIIRRRPTLDERDRLLAGVRMPPNFGPFQNGIVAPTPATPDKVDPLAIHAAIIDPIRQIIPLPDQNAENIITAAAHEAVYLDHFNINQALYGTALAQSMNFHDLRVYYGLQDYGGWNKVAMYLQAFVASDINSSARRGSDLIPSLPLSWSSLPEQMGARGVTGLFGLMKRQNNGAYQLLTETFGNFSLARYAMQTKAMGRIMSTLLGEQDWQQFADSEGFLEKPFNRDYRMFRLFGEQKGEGNSHILEKPESEVSFIDAWIESLGRYTKFNQAIVLFEYYRKSRRALDLRDEEIWTDFNNPDAGVDPAIFDNDNLGSSRHLLNLWHQRFMKYWIANSPRGAEAKYAVTSRLRKEAMDPLTIELISGIEHHDAHPRHQTIRDQTGIR